MVVFRLAFELVADADSVVEIEVDGCAFRLIGIGAHHLEAVGQVSQADLFDADPGGGDLDDVLDALRDRFGDDAVVRGRGFGVKLARHGPSKVA